MSPDSIISLAAFAINTYTGRIKKSSNQRNPCIKICDYSLVKEKK